MITAYKQFASTYSSGTYGASGYERSTVTSTSTGSTANGGTLPATGTDIMVGLIGGVLLIAIAIALFITVRRRNRK